MVPNRCRAVDGYEIVKFDLCAQSSVRIDKQPPPCMDAIRNDGRRINKGGKALEAQRRRMKKLGFAEFWGIPTKQYG